jgi:hypothetical protein
MAESAKLKKLDKPVVFALSITFVVVGTIAILGWLFTTLKWTGPLGLVKGGVVQS